MGRRLLTAAMVRQLGLGLLVLWAAGANASIDAQSDGSDGVLDVSSGTQIDLGLAADGAWDSTPPVSGQGVYDASKWAVVYKYSDVIIRSGATVTFKNHPSGAPVVWLVDGNVTVEAGAWLDLNGENGSSTLNRESIPGPGGFRGGRTNPQSWGYGPGGATGAGTSSSMARYSGGGLGYGNPRVLPLIGGSGGGSWTSGQGGAGGGAILIAANDTIQVNGHIRSNGGIATGSSYFAGSGGGIRLVSDVLTGSGYVSALCVAFGQTPDSHGRIRFEANLIDLTSPGNPAASLDIPGPVAQLWPEVGVPTVRVVSIDGVPVPADPRSSYVFPTQDVSVSSVVDSTILIECTNVPTNSSLVLRITPRARIDTQLLHNASFVSGDATLSTWEVTGITLPDGLMAMIARVELP